MYSQIPKTWLGSMYHHVWQDEGSNQGLPIALSPKLMVLELRVQLCFTTGTVKAESDDLMTWFYQVPTFLVTTGFIMLQTLRVLHPQAFHSQRFDADLLHREKPDG